MIQKKKNTAGKIKSQKKKSVPHKRKARKPKVYIPANKIIALCTIVVILCTALLLVNTLSEINVYHSEKTASAEIQRPVQTEKKSGGQQKPSGNVKSQAEKKPEVKKQELPENKKSEAEKNISKKDASSPVKQPEAPVSSASSEKTVSQVKKPSSGIPEIPTAVNGAKLVLIFDDGGQNLSQLESFLALPFPVTVAVLPKLAHSKQAAERVRKSGKELMLHQPMQAINLSVNPGPGAITPDMTLYEIETLLRENIAEIGPVRGVNNHEGSLICEDEVKIGTVLQVCSNMGLYFVDSRTTSQTRVPQAAMSLGLSYYERNVFIDNTKNRADIISEIMKGVSIANKNGAAIMIGHVWSADVLPEILSELYPLLSGKGYVFTTVSASGALITP
ncbi:MAG: divergent polysaccharide deacetylase family protein [Treponema porcinum]|uniref:divergent polysaccharide deacetylase family protein n=1 Tax=Treponema porcinum TaxID=261392 RepID=UPI002A814855|nr:divergent polysaccharide deacetylase family protein [Treponema porcinum]MDY5048074.1 divergent polysaccharide deacetylase family protein [Treponema porcinum]